MCTVFPAKETEISVPVRYCIPAAWAACKARAWPAQVLAVADAIRAADGVLIGESRREAKALPAFKPQWDARKGAEQLYAAYKKSGITLEGSNITELEMSCFTGDYVTGSVSPEYLRWVEQNQLS